MSRRVGLTAEQIADLKQRNLPRCAWGDVLSLKDDSTMDADDARLLDEYLRRFLPPSEKCVMCDTTQGGLMGALCGGFAWSIAHGEGFCGHCGYPGRGLHYDFGPVKRLSIILQYHPNELQQPKKKAS